MRTINYTTQFKRDYRREKSGRHAKVLDELFERVINILVLDIPLPKQYKDHSLKGEWQDCGDCHVKPDLVLIYRKSDTKTLELVRIGSHSELGW